MEGLSDGRALKTILPQINPRKLVRLDNLLYVVLRLILVRTGHRRWFGRCYSRSRCILQIDHFDDTGYLHTLTRREGRGRRGNEEFLDSIRRFNHGFSSVIQGEISSFMHPFAPHKLMPGL